MTKNWFDQGGADYAAFRPDYPPALSLALARLSPARQRAVDVGCGAGQLTLALADHFETVVGMDPGVNQIAHAPVRPNVSYVVAPAEATGLEAGSADLITAAQAAHWFDLPAFYAEARRIAVPGALLALITYGAPVLEADLRDRFDRFYADEIGPFWPPERALVDSGYAGIDFPFPELEAPASGIERDWSLPQLLGYVGTWSASRRAREAGRSDVLDAFASDLAAAWGDPERPRRLTWPIRMRLGRV